MGLRSKVLAVLFSMCAIITAIIYFYSTSTLINDYLSLEKEETIKNIVRASRTLDNFQTSLKALNSDWSMWDDVYKFMKEKNQTFIDANLTSSTFANVNINLMLFFDSQGILWYGLNYDLASKKFIPLPNEIVEQLEADKRYSQISEIKTLRTGLVKASTGYMMLSASPIVTSQGKGPIMGTLVMGSYFNDQQLANLSSFIYSKTSITPLALAQKDPSFNATLSELKQGKKNVLHAVNRHLIYGYTFIRDINNHPIGILRIESPRIIYNQGLKTIQKYLGIIMLIGLAFIIVVWILLEKLIFKRMLSISKQVININSENDFANRIMLKGNDELANMAKAINSLMELIELSQEQLKGRIKQRTEALEQISLLNKNLYHEISRQKEIENKLLADKQTLRQMAYYDTLTGLPNRQSFNELLRKTFLEAQGTDSKFAVMFLDADHFKSINDNYGHVIGDQFLIVTAARLEYAIHNKAIGARISGDEFNILITESIEKDYLSQLTNKILHTLSEPVSINDVTIQHTFSIGISIYPDDAETVEALRNHADIAMYHAKKQPKNAFFYYADIKNDERIV